MRKIPEDQIPNLALNLRCEQVRTEDEREMPCRSCGLTKDQQGQKTRQSGDNPLLPRLNVHWAKCAQNPSLNNEGTFCSCRISHLQGITGKEKPLCLSDGFILHKSHTHLSSSIKRYSQITPLLWVLVCQLLFLVFRLCEHPITQYTSIVAKLRIRLTLNSFTKRRFHCITKCISSLFIE